MAEKTGRFECEGLNRVDAVVAAHRNTTTEGVDQLAARASGWGYYAQALGVVLRDLMPLAEDGARMSEMMSDNPQDVRADRVLVDRAKEILKRLDDHEVLHVRDIRGADLDVAFEIKFED